MPAASRGGMGEPLDTRTLLVVAATVTIVLVIGQALQWRSHREVPGTGHWAAMNASLVLGFALLAARGVVPDLLSIVAANLIVLAGLGTGLAGVRRFWGLPSDRVSRRVAVLVLVAVAIALVWLTYVTPSFHARVVMMSLVPAAVLGATAWLLVRHTTREMRAISYATAAAPAAVSMLFVVRAYHHATWAGADEGILSSTEFQSATWLLVIMTAIGWTMGLLLLVSRRVVLELRETQLVLEHLAGTDALTGILNRRSFFERAESELLRARRYGTALSVIVFDVDHFKRINDVHGHATGDEVLKALVERFAEELRDQDVFARIGGEEFAIVAPQVEAEGATILAQRLCDLLAAEPIPTPSSGPLTLSASFGVAALSPDRDTVAALLRSADEALYRAKAAGRGRVVVDGSVDAPAPNRAPAPVRSA